MAIRRQESARAAAPPQERLATALLDTLRRQPPLGDIRGKVALDVTDGEGWTMTFAEHGLTLSGGADQNADTRIICDAATGASVIGGETSGVDAFLDGRLRVRGNLNLSLRLTELLERPLPPTFAVGKHVRAEGVHTFYLEAGRGTPVVLLHGLGATNASLLPTLQNLARDHRVIAPDLPGFGASGKPLRSYDARFYGKWLQSFMDEVGIERAHLVGNSMGGRVAIELGLQAPDRVDRLCLFAPSPAFIRKREFVRFVKLARPELALVPLVLGRKYVIDSLKSMFSRPGRLDQAWYDAAADEFLRVFKTPRGRVAFFSAARQIYLEEPHGDEGFWDRLPSLSRPSLFIWGSRDVLVPSKFAKHVERVLPTAISVVLPDCGHVPQYEHPDRTHALMRTFFEGHDPRV